jgi:hypothetical protein
VQQPHVVEPQACAPASDVAQLPAKPARAAAVRHSASIKAKVAAGGANGDWEEF